MPASAYLSESAISSTALAYRSNAPDAKGAFSQPSSAPDGAPAAAPAGARAAVPASLAAGTVAISGCFRGVAAPFADAEP